MSSSAGLYDDTASKRDSGSTTKAKSTQYGGALDSDITSSTQDGAQGQVKAGTYWDSTTDSNSVSNLSGSSDAISSADKTTKGGRTQDDEVVEGSINYLQTDSSSVSPEAITSANTDDTATNVEGTVITQSKTASTVGINGGSTATGVHSSPKKDVRGHFRSCEEY